jgi:hypothetical protein
MPFEKGGEEEVMINFNYLSQNLFGKLKSLGTNVILIENRTRYLQSKNQERQI